MSNGRSSPLQHRRMPILVSSRRITCTAKVLTRTSPFALKQFRAKGGSEGSSASAVITTLMWLLVASAAAGLVAGVGVGAMVDVATGKPSAAGVDAARFDF